MDWEKHGNKLLAALEEIAEGAFGALVYHFLTEKRAHDGTVVVDKDGKPVRTLDMSRVRSEAPHFARSAADEAEFAAIKNGLRPDLITSLEGWMPTLGNHQRADVILTVSEMTVRKDLHADSIENRKLAREAALKALEQLASEPDGPAGTPVAIRFAAKNAHAVSFKFMKANENEYLGSRLSARASTALQAAITAFNAAKTDFDTWANGVTAEINARQAEPRTIWRAWRRMFSLPWE